MKKNLFLLVINFTIIFTSSAIILPDSLLFKKNNESKESSLFLMTIGYKVPINNNKIINSGHGIYIEGGINPGKLISKKLVVGLYAGWSFMDRLWSTSFNQKFVDDYNTSIGQDRNFSELDSGVIYSSGNLMQNVKGSSPVAPGCEMRSFHNYSLYYGCVIKLPVKYIPIIKLYTGTTRSHYQGSNIVTRERDFNIFELRRAMYGCELIVFKGIEELMKNRKHSSNINTGALSIYCEYSNLTNSSLYFYDGVNSANIPLKKFTSDLFMNKYKHEVSFGFKVSLFII